HTHTHTHTHSHTHTHPPAWLHVSEEWTGIFSFFPHHYLLCLSFTPSISFLSFSPLLILSLFFPSLFHCPSLCLKLPQSFLLSLFLSLSLSSFSLFTLHPSYSSLYHPPPPTHTHTYTHTHTHS